MKRFSVIAETYKSKRFDEPQRTLSDEDKAFQKLILHGDYASCTEFIQKRIGGSVTFRRLCLGLMSNAARDLGEQWSRDELSFTDVTVALARLHVLLHDFSKAEWHKSIPESCSIVLANAATEQHAFGLSVVSKVFEFEGWTVAGGPYLQVGSELHDMVRGRSFDVAGISAATADNARALEAEITTLRRTSLNPDIAILVGGGGFSEDPDLFRQIGADEIADDADEAVIKARALLGYRLRPSP